MAQGGHQVFAVRVAAFGLVQLGGIGVELDRRLGGPVHGDLELGVLVADHLVGPVEDQMPVGPRYPEQLGDDDQGQLGDQIGDEVGPPRLDDTVDDLVGSQVDPLLQL